jgi:hypothetical protein
VGGGCEWRRSEAGGFRRHRPFHFHLATSMRQGDEAGGVGTDQELGTHATTSHPGPLQTYLLKTEERARTIANHPLLRTLRARVVTVAAAVRVAATPLIEKLMELHDRYPTAALLGACPRFSAG